MNPDEPIEHLRDAIAMIEQAIEMIERGASPADLLVNAIGQLERAIERF